MSTILFILGAGASKQAGAPLMGEFMGYSRDLMARNQVADKIGSFQNVFKAIGILQSVHSKCNLDLNNVESVFTAFEMGRTLGGLPGYDLAKTEQLIKDMKILIAKTIEQTLLFPITQKGLIEPPRPYDRFCELIHHLQTSPKAHHRVAVLTFNYDLAPDWSLAAKGLKPNYGFEDEPAADGVPLLKLHGSLNWIYCDECLKVFPFNPMMKNATDFYQDGKLPDYAENVPMPIERWLDEFKCCNHKYSKQPLIVPPTWNKSEYHVAMPRVWARAAHELHEAEYIFVIGYSFPLSDLFFQHLYGLGTVSDTPLRRFWVCNPDRDTVEPRFRNLLGRGAERVFEYKQWSFHDAVENIRDSFR